MVDEINFDCPSKKSSIYLKKKKISLYTPDLEHD